MQDGQYNAMPMFCGAAVRRGKTVFVTAFPGLSLCLLPVTVKGDAAAGASEAACRVLIQCSGYSQVEMVSLPKLRAWILKNWLYRRS